MEIALTIVLVIALMMLIFAAFVTVLIVIEDLEIVDNYILWVEDKAEKFRDAFRNKRGG